MSEVLALLIQLIACPSITPHDAGCQKIIASRLEKIGFKIETMQFGDVTNLWARYGTKPPLVVFAGHTDVVPPGPEDKWTYPPFQAKVVDGKVFGRGATDMKGALSSMIIAVEKFINENPKFDGSIGFIITSDEEGPGKDGTEKVVQKLQTDGVKIDYAIVGEASSNDVVGDQLRVGRRGSLHGKLRIFGKQGHVAYPQAVINPIHKTAQAIHELANTRWDEGNQEFPPTSFQITNIHAGTGAANVVPGEMELLFNFRFGTASSIAALQKRTEEILENIGLKYDLQWTVGAKPFLTTHGKLITVAEKVIKEVSGITPRLSTGGGTSDGRFIAPTGAEVIELGVLNHTAHQIDEHVAKKDLETLQQYYWRILQLIFDVRTLKS